MRILGLAALLLVGCGPAQAVIDDADDTGGGDDTAIDDTGSPDQNDTGPNDTGNSGEPDLTSWSGRRTFHFDDVYGQGPCEDSVDESGQNVTDDIDYAGAVGVCPECDAIYVISVTPGTLCEEQTAGAGLPVATEIMRGLEFSGEQDVTVHVIRYSNLYGWSADTLAEGTLTSTELDYAYTGNVYGVDFSADGTVDF